MSKATSEHVLKALMLLSLDGDETAYRRLLTILRDLLVSFYRRRLGPRYQAEVDDLVQDVLLALHTRRVTYDRERPFTAWFFRVAKYKLIDHFRRAKGRAELGVAEIEDIAADFSEESWFATMDVDRMLNSLPAHQRDLVLLVKLDGKTAAEAGVETGQSEINVRVGIHRGLKALRMRFGTGGDRHG